MAKKPNELNESTLATYLDELQSEHDELEEKQGEKESEARQVKIDDLANRIELVEAAIEALGSVE